MLVSNPSAIPGVLKTLLDNAGKQALTEPDKIGQLFDKLPKPGDPSSVSPLDALKQFWPPDWWSLLVFVLVEIQEKIGDPELWVGIQQPPGWARMITLNYSPGATVNQPPPAPVLTLGLALGDSQQGTLNQGIWINLGDHVDQKQLGSDPVQLTLSGQGNGSWHYEFGGALPALLPAGATDSWVDLKANWNPGWNAGGANSIFDVSAGALLVEVRLAAAAPHYAITVGFGPLSGSLNPAAALGPLAQGLVQLAPTQIHYYPQVVLKQDSAPAFTLGS